MNGHPTEPKREQDAQLWSGILHNIQSWHKLQPKVISGFRQINILSGNLSDETVEPTSVLKNKLEKAYDSSKQDLAEEKRLIKEALDRMSILIASRLNPPEVDDKRNKKRKLDSPVASPQPAQPNWAASPPRASIPMSTSLSGRSNAPPAAARPIVKPVPPAGAPQRNEPPRKVAKRDGPQILTQGRPVAFKPPDTKTSEGERPQFIMARVVKSLGGDNYQVQDVEPDDGGNAGAIFTTSIRFIIPLPDPKDKSTFPTHEFLASTEIMALYPETTTFYHGKVVAPPSSNKVIITILYFHLFDQAKQNKHAYKVIFDEDGGTIQSVAIEHVALWPRHL